MASTVTIRSAVRKSLAELLSDALGPKVDVVHNHRVSDLGYMTGGAPVSKAVVVTASSVGALAGGSGRERETTEVRSMTNFFINVVIFVSSAYDQEASAEDALDALEAAVSDVIIDNATVPGSWALLEIIDRSRVDEVPLVSNTYLRETIPVRIELYDD